MVVIFISASFGYYLIEYQLRFIKGEMYYNTLTSSSSEIVAYIISGYLMEKLGLKVSFVLAYIISLAGMFSLLFYSGDDKFMFSLFVMGSKFGLCLSYNLAFLANYGLFPVSIQSTAMGICNIFAKLFTILTPYISELKPQSIS